jgi:alpha-amylase/alpha-mannosidase (GH57 family)
MAARARLALVWHMHQPSYRDALSGRVLLPWTRLHVTKDYRDMVEILGLYPRVHATFNLTPALLEQVESLAEGAPDDYLELARRPPENLTSDERRFMARQFFSVRPETMLKPHARYRELWDRHATPRSGRSPAAMGVSDLRDLAVWFHLAWVDPSYFEEEPIRSLLEKGRGFSESEKQALLDWGVSCAAATLPAYRAAAERGQVELTTSAYHHPILPLLIDTDAPREGSPTIALPAPARRAPEDAREQIRRARAFHESRFGTAPRGTWPPEGAVSNAALAMLRSEGFGWAASDETVLASALGGRPQAAVPWQAALYRPYAVETPSGAISMVFRDRALSDLIGFTYMHWEPERAARDFVDRVLAAAETASAGRAEERGPGGGSGTPLITVILDGENCWESYPQDGRPFLTALYAALEAEGRIEAVTVSEALEREAHPAPLRGVSVGSWIRSDLGVWVGHPEKNRAWEEVGRLRERIGRARAAGATQEADAAREELLIAEASDWFWWYGDDHQSTHRDEIDGLFRAHLIRGYSLLGLPAPASIRRSLRGTAGVTGEAERPPLVRASLDGRETDFFEWRAAQVFNAQAEAGAAEPGRALVTKLYFGVSASDLYVRADFGSADRGGVVMALRFTGPPDRTARIPVESLGAGEPAWSQESAGEAGAFALGTVLEVRLPFARIAATLGSAVRWHVELERAGALLQIAPRSGAFVVEVPDEDFTMKMWSAT